MSHAPRAVDTRRAERSTKGVEGMRSFLMTLVLGSLMAAAPLEAGLAPTKGSQLVTLLNSGACPITGHPNAVVVQQRVAPDGSTAVFTIPAKKILVVTDVEISSVAQTPGDVMFASVLIGNGERGDLVALNFEPASPAGTVRIEHHPNTGIAVRAGNVVCADMVDTKFPAAFVGLTAVVRGYLASDK
jgi:hypothetical protein